MFKFNDTESKSQNLLTILPPLQQLSIQTSRFRTLLSITWHYSENFFLRTFCVSKQRPSLYHAFTLNVHLNKKALFSCISPDLKSFPFSPARRSSTAANSPISKRSLRMKASLMSCSGKSLVPCWPWIATPSVLAFWIFSCCWTFFGCRRNKHQKLIKTARWNSE